MARVVGNANRSPYILDPLEAWRAGRRVDGMFAVAAKRETSVLRTTRRQMDEMNEARQRQAMASRGRHG